MNELIELNKNEMALLSPPNNNYIISRKNICQAIGNSNSSLPHNVGSLFRVGIQGLSNKNHLDPAQSFASFVQGADYFYKNKKNT